MSARSLRVLECPVHLAEPAADLEFARVGPQQPLEPTSRLPKIPVLNIEFGALKGLRQRQEGSRLRGLLTYLRVCQAVQ